MNNLIPIIDCLFTGISTIIVILSLLIGLIFLISAGIGLKNGSVYGGIQADKWTDYAKIVYYSKNTDNALYRRKLLTYLLIGLSLFFISAVFFGIRFSHCWNKIFI